MLFSFRVNELSFLTNWRSQASYCAIETCTILINHHRTLHHNFFCAAKLRRIIMGSNRVEGRRSNWMERRTQSFLFPHRSQRSRLNNGNWQSFRDYWIGCFASSTFQGVFYHRQNFLVAAKSHLQWTRHKLNFPNLEQKRASAHFHLTASIWLTSQISHSNSLPLFMWPEFSAGCCERLLCFAFSWLRFQL